MKRYSVFVSCFVAVVACGGNNHNNGDDDDGNADANNGSGSGSQMGSGSNLPAGVYGIPLTSPDGSFWAPTLTVGGVGFVMDLDTGSTSTGIAGSTCSNCSVSPEYTPGSGAVSTGGSATTEYADESGWTGSIYTDTIGLENGSPSATLNIVDITAQMFAQDDPTYGFFDGNVYQGILGMGPPANAEPNTGAYFDTITQAGVADEMAFELCDSGGTMWLGGYDASHTSGTIAYTPTYSDQYFYAIQPSAIAMGGSAIMDKTMADYEDWVVDTGTTFFYLPTAMESGVIKALNNDANFKTLFPGATLKDDPDGSGVGCTPNSSVTDAEVESMLPPFQMTLPAVGGGSAVTVSATPLKSYLYDQGSGSFCLGIGDGGSGSDVEVTMGDQIMQAFVTVIDLKNNQIGWATDTGCNEPRRPRDRTTFHPHLPKPHHLGNRHH